MNESNRYDEAGESIPPRKKRIYTDGQHWYFLSRGSNSHGPFKTFTEAKSALKVFLRRSGIVHFNNNPDSF